MYICLSCGAVFEEHITIVEKHNLDTPPYEEHDGCPECKSDETEEAYQCDRCGDWQPYSELEESGTSLYCEICYSETR